ncbi:MAG: chorismate synthase [Christensenellales bacterium]
MSASRGRSLRLTIFGESHGSAIGAVLDGVPAGTVIDMDSIRFEMSRRASSLSMSTPRREPDIPEILSGVLNGRATGAPIAAIIKNTDTRSVDYAALKNLPRPGHADYTAHVKYSGFNDRRGGGHFSGRLTAPLVFAGAIARAILSGFGISVISHISEIGGIKDTPFDAVAPALPEGFYQRRLPVIDETAGLDMANAVAKASTDGDSLGGIVECAAVGLIPGLGEPFFDSVESVLSAALFSIPAIKGIEFGAGFGMAKMTGSTANDAFIIKDGDIATATNNNGGINGGITNGMPLIFRCAIKPTPSISSEQQTVNLETMQKQTISISGRHDACIVPRALAAIEAATALCLGDMLLWR